MPIFKDTHDISSIYRGDQPIYAVFDHSNNLVYPNGYACGCDDYTPPVVERDNYTTPVLNADYYMKTEYIEPYCGGGSLKIPITNLCKYKYLNSNGFNAYIFSPQPVGYPTYESIWFSPTETCNVRVIIHVKAYNQYPVEMQFAVRTIVKPTREYDPAFPGDYVTDISSDLYGVPGQTMYNGMFIHNMGEMTPDNAVIPCGFPSMGIYPEADTGFIIKRISIYLQKY